VNKFGVSHSAKQLILIAKRQVGTANRPRHVFACLYEWVTPSPPKGHYLSLRLSISAYRYTHDTKSVLPSFMRSLLPSIDGASLHTIYHVGSAAYTSVIDRIPSLHCLSGTSGGFRPALNHRQLHTAKAHSAAVPAFLMKISINHTLFMFAACLLLNTRVQNRKQNSWLLNNFKIVTYKLSSNSSTRLPQQLQTITRRRLASYVELVYTFLYLNVARANNIQHASAHFAFWVLACWWSAIIVSNFKPAAYGPAR
jgi:hypothetical protein